MDGRAAQREIQGFVHRERGAKGLASAGAAAGDRRSSPGFVQTGRPGHAMNQDRPKSTSPPLARPVIARARARFRHQSHHSSDCAFEAGDQIDILEMRDHNWWLGLNTRTGRQGSFPTTHVEITEGAVGLGVLARVRAVYDFKPQQEGDLGFRAGQTVLVTELPENDWWKGKLNRSSGPEGTFPRNYVVLQSKSQPYQSSLPLSPMATREAYGYTTYNGSLCLGLPFKQGDGLVIYTKLNQSLSWGINTETNCKGVFPHRYYIRTNAGPNSAGPATGCAVASQTGTIHADLSFEKGDLIQVKQMLGNEIVWARNTRSGKEGLCPDVLLGPNNPLTPDPTVSPKDKTLYVTALYTWPGQSEGDLSMIANDQILVIGDDSDIWCNGRNMRTGVTGAFPKTYVRFPKTVASEGHPIVPKPVNTAIVSQPQPVPKAAARPTQHPQRPLPKPVVTPAPRSRLDTDLVRDSKLSTSFTEDGQVCHTSYTFHPRNRFDRIVLEEKWKAQKYLGRGGFGQVDLQECVQGQRKGELRAVKKIIKNPYQDGEKTINYDRELEAIAKFSHEKYVHCFVRSFGWYENKEAIFITMEYFQHGDLQKHMRGRFPEFEVGHITSQLLEGLSYMHDNGFAHRDLKPANILVKECSPNWWVKISDFGISKRAGGDDTALRTVVGSPRCIAPEVMGIFSPDDTEDVDSENMVYTVAVDQWALGAIAFQLLTSKDPFPQPRSLHNYMNGKEAFPSGILQESRASPPCIEFLKGLLAPIPSNRPNASLALRHLWLKEINLSPPPLEQRDTLEAEFSLLNFDTTTASLSWTEALEKSPEP